ncbi:MAG: transglutaminase-like domain-containing protein [Anaerolineales bacterium]
MTTQITPLEFYAEQSFITDPGDYYPLFSGLPDDIPAIRKVVQGLLIHLYWAEAYGYSVPAERVPEYQIRDIPGKLKRLLEMNGKPLAEPRTPDQRLVSNCRDYAVLMTSMLRYKGIPARTRIGFAAYFAPGWHEDHIIAEMWDEAGHKWVLVDPELDDIHQKALKYDFDPCDVPRQQFLPGGMAWQRCREGQADPNTFGYGNTIGGLPNIRGNLVRDFAYLNKVEVLGWDYWGLIEGDDSNLSEEDFTLLDQAASLSLAGNHTFQELRKLYLKDMRLRVPPILKRGQEDGSFVTEEIVKDNPSYLKYL